MTACDFAGVNNGESTETRGDRIIPISVGTTQIDLHAQQSGGIQSSSKISQIRIDILGQSTSMSNNTQPAAQKDRGYTAISGMSKLFNPLSNDYDPDGDTLAITRVWQLDTPINYLRYFSNS